MKDMKDKKIGRRAPRRAVRGVQERVTWRRSHDFVGLRGRTEPNHVRGSARLYGTGGEIAPLDVWQRANFHPHPSPKHNYAIRAWVKFGHLTEEKTLDGYAATVEEGKRRCDRWLAKNARKTR